MHGLSGGDNLAVAGCLTRLLARLTRFSVPDWVHAPSFLA